MGREGQQIFNQLMSHLLWPLLLLIIVLVQVVYDADGFCEKNRDVLFKDCIALLKGSSKYACATGRSVASLSIL